MLCKNLTIFEGPDGSGKSTAALEYAKKTNALYFHFDAMEGVTNPARNYIEAMQPALLGLSDVVFDRCWFSEEPYGKVYAGGRDRIGWRKQILEMLAMRCGAVVVRCDAGFENSKAAFESRPEEELLDSVDQLREVYDLYKGLTSLLPVITYNWTAGWPNLDDFLYTFLPINRPANHPVEFKSIGNFKDPHYIYVEPDLIHHCDSDANYEFPCNCMRTLTKTFTVDTLHGASSLIVDSNQNLEVLKQFKHAKIIAGQKKALDAIEKYGLTHLLR